MVKSKVSNHYFLSSGSLCQEKRKTTTAMPASEANATSQAAKVVIRILSIET